MTLLVNAKNAALALQISRAHLYAIHNNGRLGPMPVSLGRSRRWAVDELMKWVKAGSPPREIWQVIKTQEPTKIMAG